MSSKDGEYYKEQNIEYQRRIIELQEKVMQLQDHIEWLKEKHDDWEDEDE